MKRKVCPKCDIFVVSKDGLDRIFGYYTKKGHLYIQSQCKKCRRNYTPVKLK